MKSDDIHSNYASFHKHLQETATPAQMTNIVYAAIGVLYDHAAYIGVIIVEKGEEEAALAQAANDDLRDALDAVGVLTEATKVSLATFRPEQFGEDLRAKLNAKDGY